MSNRLKYQLLAIIILCIVLGLSGLPAKQVESPAAPEVAFLPVLDELAPVFSGGGELLPQAKIVGIFSGDIDGLAGEEFFFQTDSALSLGAPSGALVTYKKLGRSKELRPIAIGKESFTSVAFADVDSERGQELIALSDSRLVIKKYSAPTESLRELSSFEISNPEQGNFLGASKFDTELLHVLAINKDPYGVNKLSVLRQLAPASSDFEQIQNLALSAPVENPRGILLDQLTPAGKEEVLIYADRGFAVFSVHDGMLSLAATIDRQDKYQIKDALIDEKILYLAEVNTKSQYEPQVEALSFDSKYEVSMVKQAVLPKSYWAKNIALSLWDFAGNGIRHLVVSGDFHFQGKLSQLAILDKSLSPIEVSSNALLDVPASALGVVDLNGDGQQELIIGLDPASGFSEAKFEILANVAINDLVINKDLDFKRIAEVNKASQSAEDDSDNQEATSSALQSAPPTNPPGNNTSIGSGGNASEGGGGGPQPTPAQQTPVATNTTAPQSTATFAPQPSIPAQATVTPVPSPLIPTIIPGGNPGGAPGTGGDFNANLPQGSNTPTNGIQNPANGADSGIKNGKKGTKVIKQKKKKSKKKKGKKKNSKK